MFVARRRTAFTVAVLGVATVSGFGCAPPEAERPLAVRLDSAGVEIVGYELSETQPLPWRSVGEADLSIGVMDGAPEYVFSAIGEVVVSEDGSLVVADRQTREIRVFDESGTHLRSFGGPGGGPGEFSSSPSIAGTSDDSVFVFDSRSARVSTFGPTGELIEDVSVRSETTGRPLIGLRQADGTYLTRSRFVNPAAAAEVYEMRLVLDSIVIERLDADGQLIDTLLVEPETYRARSIQGSIDSGFRVRQAPPPYMPSVHVATQGSRVVSGFSDAFEVSWQDVNGDLERILRVGGVQHPATRADLHAIVEAELLADLGEDGITPETRQLFLEYLPESVPAFRELRVAESGDVWISLYDPEPENETVWLVFTPEAELLGSVATPAGLSVRWIGVSHVVGVVRDDLDVPYLRRHPLLPPSPDE